MASKRDLEQWAVERFGITPIEYMMGVLANPSNATTVRMEAARHAAPYIHPRLRQIELRELPREKTPQELEHDVRAILEQYATAPHATPVATVDPGGSRDLVGAVD